MKSKSGSYTLDHRSIGVSKEKCPVKPSVPNGGTNIATVQVNYNPSKLRDDGLVEVKLERSDSKDQPKQERCKQRFRFILCSLALSALSICIMSRMVLNVAIKDMERTAKNDKTVRHVTSTTKEPSIQQDVQVKVTSVPEESHSSEPQKGGKAWSPQLVMGAFYVGYFPVMLFAGRIAEKFGAEKTLLVATYGTGAITLLTPILTSNFGLILVARVLLGVVQASLVPSIYAFINRWLTETETSIFLSIVKVAMSLGVLSGYLMDLILHKLHIGWSALFYTGGTLCMIWSLTWIILSSATPNSNKYVEKEELDWIMRKKGAFKEFEDTESKGTLEKKDEVPVFWLMLKHPPVWALGIVKFTHNFALDFLLIELATYLKEFHHYESSTADIIACLGSLIQLLLVTSVGWFAKTVVQRRLFGFSRTVWRKIFQGSTNFGMALLFLILAFTEASDNVIIIGFIIICLNLVWMFGAGGEAVAANDMTLKYPATIYGFCHALAALAGIAITLVAKYTVEDDPTSYKRWKFFFIILAVNMIVGGLAFIFGFKAKRFLPGEVEDKTTVGTELTVIHKS